MKDNIADQAMLLHAMLKQNTVLYDVLQRVSALQMPNWYIGAGCVAQTIWNIQLDHDACYGIDDIDLVYYDNEDTSLEAENAWIRSVQAFSGVPLRMDVNNQARVHLWYEDFFGYPIAPYQSVEDAIQTWPTTATAVGVRLVKDRLYVYAPFGLDDLFSQTIKPNKRQITKQIYEMKCKKWKLKWPSLHMLPW